MPSPFSTLPLANAPYNSRYQTKLNSDPAVNYYLLPFNPGYALQASELNEIQELFFINQNLTQRMNANWMKAGYNIPYWEGAIPLDPGQVMIDRPISFSGSQITIGLTISEGWYLWTDFSSKLSHWVYNDQAIVASEDFVALSNATGYIGIRITDEEISCCASGTCLDTQDSTLRDNSQGTTVTENTCGASRFKVTFDSVDVFTALTYSAAVVPLLQFNSDGTATFIDGQSITVPTA